MQVIPSRIATVPIDSIRPHPANPNEGDAGAVHHSIEVNGFYGRVLVQESTGYILAGEHRWRAAKMSGATEIPAEFEDVDDDRALHILTVDNRLTRQGHDDLHKLRAVLEQMETTGSGLDGSGFDGDDLDEIIALLDQTTANDDDEGPTRQLVSFTADLTYTITFDDAEQQQAWTAFVAALQRALPQCETLGQMIQIMCLAPTVLTAIERLGD